MDAGFIPALCTPLDAEGNFLEDSFRHQVEDQIAAGASGLLCMGSMGQQAFIKGGECPKAARAAVEAAAGRVPVFVGVMDNSIARVRERMQAMEHLAVSAFVLTTPYYHPVSPDQIANYYKGTAAAAAASGHDILMYDLPGVTQSKITYGIIKKLLGEIPNLVGIKSADLAMFRQLKLDPQVPDRFQLIYSGLDTFDVAYRWGIDKNLDGMLSCTPVTTGKLFRALKAGDYDKAASELSRIIALRDFFVAHDLWPAFSAAMNLLGYEGNFAPDYVTPVSAACVEEIRLALQKMGEL